MRRASPRVAILAAALAALSSCAGPAQQIPAGSPDPAAADLLLERHWLAVPGVWRVRQSVLFEGRGAAVSLQGFLELDTARRRARLAGLDEMGTTLFVLTVTPEAGTSDFLLPGFDRRGDFTPAVASCVRRVYLEPAPDRGDTLLAGPEVRRLTRQSADKETGFTFTPGGLLLATEIKGGGESWRAEYRGHREVDGIPVPGTVVLEDRKGGYRLSIAQDEMRWEGIPGHDPLPQEPGSCPKEFPDEH